MLLSQAVADFVTCCHPSARLSDQLMHNMLRHFASPLPTHVPRLHEVFRACSATSYRHSTPAPMQGMCDTVVG